MDGVAESLEFLLRERVCDSTTVERLSQNEQEFIDEFVTRIATGYELAKKRNTALKHPREKNLDLVFGEKLIALETLTGLPEETQGVVGQWLADPKRTFLFIHSTMGELYLETLSAKAQGTLDSFRDEYNPHALDQPSFSYETTLRVTPNPEVTNRTLASEKLDAILQEIKETSTLPRAEALYQECNNTSTIIDHYAKLKAFQKQRKLLKIDPNNERQIKEVTRSWTTNPYAELEALIESEGYLERNKPDREPENEYSERDFFYELARTSEELIDLLPPQQPITPQLALDTDIDPREDLIWCLKTKVKIYEKALRQARTDFDRRFNGLKKALHNGDSIISYFSDGDGLGMRIPFVALTTEQENELKTIAEELNEVKKQSSRLKNVDELTYTFGLSDKDPLDIRFGNDSGCCIGVYERGIDAGNADGIPHMILDNTTYIFNIHQHINNRTPKRTGMVLAFDATDEEKRKILVCNSLELSAAMNPISIVREVVSYVEDGLAAFAREHNYDMVLMGSHSYNTSRNYSTRGEHTLEHSHGMKKVSKPDEPEFYSEVIDPYKPSAIQSTNGFYVLYTRETEE